MKFNIIISLFIFFIASVHNLNGQKLGHINSALIIQEHPKVTAANLELENFQKMLADSFSIKVTAFENKYKSYLDQSSTGILSAVAAEAKQKELRADQEALTTEEQQLKFRLLQKRETLLKPILADLDAIIQGIGKEGNYTMIFDTSVAGALLFAEQSEDLTDMVRNRCAGK